MPLLAMCSKAFECVAFDTPVLQVSEATRRLLASYVRTSGWFVEANLPLLERCSEETPSDTDLKVLIAAIRRDGHVYVRWI